MSDATNQWDEHFLQLALQLARRGLGTTFPNPSVGAIIVRDGQVIATGHTAKGGRPHAEVLALQRAGGLAKGATMYVTLEPCCHFGSTPPCSQALVASGLSRIVIATKDPDSRVCGNGIKQLQTAGIAVTYGICEAEAIAVNSGFFSVITRGRPLITLKLATTLDGKIALMSGESKWITGPHARNYAHLLRAQHDAILIGSGTALADNPLLDCRLPGLEDRSPIRIVADSALQTPLGFRLVQTAKTVPLWLLACQDTVIAQPEKIAALQAQGATIIPIARKGSHIDIAQAIHSLAERGITRLLVEGGGTLAASLVKAQLVDRLIWLRSPIILGTEGKPAIGALNIHSLLEASTWKQVEYRKLGNDMLETFTCSLATV